MMYICFFIGGAVAEGQIFNSAFGCMKCVGGSLGLGCKRTANRRKREYVAYNIANDDGREFYENEDYFF